jgi:hypothetical protein
MRRVFSLAVSNASLAVHDVLVQRGCPQTNSPTQKLNMLLAARGVRSPPPQQAGRRCLPASAVLPVARVSRQRFPQKEERIQMENLLAGRRDAVVAGAGSGAATRGGKEDIAIAELEVLCSKALTTLNYNSEEISVLMEVGMGVRWTPSSLLTATVDFAVGT